ncbi:MAG TPA: 3-oxoacyl-[acyl-carrier-protein] synthase III C-terminal domain-containing protein [Rubricoccaceae bacterium]|jgi:3-oxoacyl-[acyl-carrier-protein] synthase-3
MHRVQIAGTGCYLPPRVVPSADVEAWCGVPAGWAEAHAGVRERRRAEGETASDMAAKASRDALAAAGLEARDVDLVISASGTPEQPLPDGGVLLHRALGLTAVPAFAVHATCLGFLAALHLAAPLVAAGAYRRVLIACGEVSSGALNPAEPESAVLFGDGAAAAILTPTPAGEASAVEAVRFETFSEGADLTAVRGGGSRLHPNRPDRRDADFLFAMDGRGVLRLTMQHLVPFLDALRPGLARGLVGIDRVVPHQASRAGFRLMEGLGWPTERVEHTLAWTGNCVAASIPIALHTAVAAGRIGRGDRVLLTGTGAGLTLGGIVLTF